MADASSILFWSLAIHAPDFLAEQVDDVPLDADSVEGLEEIAQVLGTGLNVQAAKDHTLVVALGEASEELKRLTAGGRHDSLHARAALAKLAYVLRHVPPEELSRASRNLFRSGLAVYTKETARRKQARAALTPLVDGRTDPMFLHIDELDLPVAASKRLHEANILFVGELVRKSEPELLKIKLFGFKRLKEVRDILGDLNLSLGTALKEPFDVAAAEVAYRARLAEKKPSR